jgi:hypothetical protein
LAVTQPWQLHLDGHMQVTLAAGALAEGHALPWHCDLGAWLHWAWTQGHVNGTPIKARHLKQVEQEQRYGSRSSSAEQLTKTNRNRSETCTAVCICAMWVCRPRRRHQNQLALTCVLPPSKACTRLSVTVVDCAVQDKGQRRQNPTDTPVRT